LYMVKLLLVSHYEEKKSWVVYVKKYIRFLEKE
jgi:hypothetical protein